MPISSVWLNAVGVIVRVIVIVSVSIEVRVRVTAKGEVGCPKLIISSCMAAPLGGMVRTRYG